MVEMKRRLVVKIDCTKDFSSDQYFSCGEVKVVKGPAGKYRECEAKPLSRFGYRFQIENVGKPHLVKIRYPDDKKRFIIINDGTTYDLSTGITTGWAQPLSNKMLEIEQVFWPRWTDCSITCMTWGHGEPAAMGSVEVYELAEDRLPVLEMPKENQDRSRRELGIQYEDPCGTGYSEGATYYEQWLDRVVEYSKYTGQKLLSYPICWYHGPFFSSKREPSDCLSIVMGADRTIYGTWTTEPSDWPAVLLERFGKEGLEFQGVLTLLRLGSLMKRMNIDLESIKAGAETINNMLWNNQVQSSANDWTAIYNARNYPSVVGSNVFEKNDRAEWAYGEKHGPFHAGPMFNPLHPIVQEAIVGFVDEIGQRYGKYKAFRGIAITMWAPTLIWFGSIHAGYDDYTVGLFEKETGIHVNVDPKAPDRFSKRYEFLTFYCKPAWVAWRCRKIRDLIGKMRDALVKHRKDLRLTLNMWQEPYIPCLLGSGEIQHQLNVRPNGATLWREAGFDLNLLGQEPNVEIDYQSEGGQRDRTPSLEENAKLEKFCMFRDHDYLDQETLDLVHKQDRTGVFIFNAWHEAWGKHSWSWPKPNDPQVEQVSYIYGKKAEGVFVLRSEYPKDDFWWDSQLRITAAYQPGVHFMEQYAHAMAELDALRITRGGLFLEKGHSEQIREFAKAYRALPKQKFATVGQSTDPVAVRTLIADGRRYFYLVNREYYPVDVEIHFDKAIKKVTELATGDTNKAGKKWSVKLGPYELKSLAVEAKVGIVDFGVKIPSKIVSGLMKDAANALKAVEKVKKLGKEVPGMDRMAERINQAMKDKRYAWLRRALTGYTIRKCLEISS